MSAKSAPYFIEFENLRRFPGPDPLEQTPVYPEPSHTDAPDANMYALADGAMQAHQERNQFANLVEAAEAVNHEAPHEIQLQDGENMRRSSRKRKLHGSDGGQDEVQLEHQASSSSMTATPISTSATALFRKPSSKSTKYTRPPMSKLFSSLELPPEHFLQLQSAAKGYMLDSAHTERQDTVGQRGKGDSELVKLRLYECVKDFLDNEGNGERFFGEKVLGEDGLTRKMLWPRDKNLIIGQVTPLLRRMVTNERQRQYAVETRKGGESEAKKPRTDDKQPLSHHVSMTPSARALFLEMTGRNLEDYPITGKYAGLCRDHDPSLAAQIDNLRLQWGAVESEAMGILASIDFHLRVFHHEGLPEHTSCAASCEDEFIQRMAASTVFQHIANEQYTTTGYDNLPQLLVQTFRLVRSMVSRTPSLTTLLDDSVPSYAGAEDGDASAAGPLADAASVSQQQPLMLHISYLSESGVRLRPRRDVAADTAPYLHIAAQEAVSYEGPSETQVGGKKTRVRVLTATGLVEVTDDEKWRAAIDKVKALEWMDGVVKVVVDLA